MTPLLNLDRELTGKDGDVVDRKRPKVVFPFVEAGFGHIMPATAAYTAFKEKYGTKVDIVKTYFYQDTNNADMKYVEDEFVNEVKKHNRNRLNGLMQFSLLGMFGTRFSMKYLMEYRYRRSFQASLQYLQELDADLIFNTHFSTLYLSCVARSRGMIDSEIMTYCPDPILGKQWDSRGDSYILSSAVGQKKAQKQYNPYFAKQNVDFPNY